MSSQPLKAFAVLSLAFVMGVSGTIFARQAGPQNSQTQPAASEKNPGTRSLQSENPEEALRHSAPVKAIARLTGLDVDKAYWLCVGVNLLVLFSILGVIAKKRLPGMFRSRTESIQKRLEESRKTSEEARRRLAEVEGRLARLDTEIQQMRSEAEASGQAEEQRILAAAEEERRRIVQSAEQEIAMAASSARRELKSYAAELAVELAGKRIQIGDGADQALVREFTAQLGKDGN
jgi:F-type H+-transporting ATPase subunit b